MASRTCMKLKLGFQKFETVHFMDICMMPGEHFTAGYTMRDFYMGLVTCGLSMERLNSLLTNAFVCFISMKEGFYVRYTFFLME